MATFNHTRADGFYDPCDQCWAEMSDADRAESLVGGSRDPDKVRSMLEAGMKLDEIREREKAT